MMENKNVAKQNVEEEDEDDEVNAIGNITLIIAITMLISYVVLFYCEFPNEPLYMSYSSFNTYLLVTESAKEMTLSKVKNFEDMETFFSKIVIPKLYQVKNNVLEPEIDDEYKMTRYHFVNEYNYLCGMRITIRQANLVKNEDEISENVLPNIRSDEYSSAEGDIEGEVTTKQGDFEYSKDNTYKKSGGFGIFFAGNLTLVEARNLWNKTVDAGLLNPHKTISFVTEFLLYNANYRVSLYNNFVAVMCNTGSLTITRNTKGFYPQNYESFVSRSDLTLFFIFQIIFQLPACLVLLDILLKLLRLISDLYYRKRISITSLFIMDFAMTAFSMTSIVLYYILNFGRSQHFSIPMDRSQYQYWVDYSSMYETYYVINSILVILLGSRTILILTKKFPVFGALFQTIQNSTWDLLNYLLLIVVLALTFSFLSFFLFGIRNNTHSSLKESIFEFFKNLVGCKSYDSMAASARILSSLFIIFFNVIMIIVLMRFLTAILLKNYRKIRETRQLTTEANARMVEEEGAIRTQKFLNLICCVDPTPSNPETDHNNSDNSAPHDVDNYINKQKQKDQTQNTKLSVWEICKINFHQLFKTEVLTVEQVSNKRKQKIEELEKEREEQEKQEKKYKERNIIFSVWNLFIFLIFLIVYTSMIFTQIPINDLYDSNKCMGDLFKNVKDVTDLSDMHCVDQLLDLFNIVIQALYIDRTGHKLSTKELVFTNPILRITMRRVKLFLNEDNYTVNLIPVRRQNSNGDQEDSTSPYLGITNNTNPSSEKILFPYYGSGSYNTYQYKGGVVFYTPVNADKADIVADYVLKAKNYQLKLIAIEMLTYSQNGGIFVKSDLVADYYDSGEVKASYKNKSFRMSQYSGSLLYRSIAEILVCILCFYFNYCTIYDYLIVWERIRTEDNKGKLKAEPGSTRSQRILIFLNIDPEQAQKEGTCEVVMSVISNSIKLLIIWIRRIIFSFFIFIFSDFGMLLQVCWLVLLNMQIFAWIRVIFFQTTLVYMEEADPQIDYFGFLSEMSNIQSNYILLTAWASQFAYLCLIRFFSFSDKMTMLYTVLSRAKINLLFFLILFFIMIFGFTIAGMMLFGTNTSHYKKFLEAFLSTFKITVGNSKFNDMNDTNPTVAPLYFIVFNFLFYLLMLRIFAALIAVFYEQTMNELEQKEKNNPPKGILIMITNELRRKYYENLKKLDDNFQMTNEEKEKQAYQAMPFVYKIVGFLRGEKYKKKSEKILKVDNIEKKVNEEKKEENKTDSLKLNSLLEEYKNTKNQNFRRNLAKDVPPLEKVAVSTWISILEMKLIKYSEEKIKFSEMALHYCRRHLHIKYYPKYYSIDEESVSLLSEVDSDSQYPKGKEDTKNVKQMYEYWEYLDALQEYNNVDDEEKDSDEKKNSEATVNINKIPIGLDEITSRREMWKADSMAYIDSFFNSAEYFSFYSFICSRNQKKFWDSMDILTKTEMWIFYMSGKSRAKLWNYLKFSADKIKDFCELERIEPYSTLSQLYEYANSNKKTEIERHQFLYKLFKYLLEDRVTASIQTLTASLLRDIIEAKCSGLIVSENNEYSRSISIVEEEGCCCNKKPIKEEEKKSNLEELRKHLFEKITKLYNIYQEEHSYDDRCFFWGLLTIEDKIEIFLNHMNGDILSSENKIRDYEADALAMLLVIENPRFRGEKKRGSSPEYLLNNEVNYKSFLRGKESAKLQQKLSIKTLAQEKIYRIDQDLEQKEKDILKYAEDKEKYFTQLENLNK